MFLHWTIRMYELNWKLLYIERRRKKNKYLLICEQNIINKIINARENDDYTLYIIYCDVTIFVRHKGRYARSGRKKRDKLSLERGEQFFSFWYTFVTLSRLLLVTIKVSGQNLSFYQGAAIVEFCVCEVTPIVRL